MPANPGLWYGTSPYAPTIQVKNMQVYATLPKPDASSRASKSHNQDKIHKSGWHRWQRKNWRWRGHGSMTSTYWTTLTIRSSL